MTIYGERIRQVRELSRLTQAELAENIGATQPAVSHMESGRTQPSIFMLDRIAMVTGFLPSFFRQPPGPEFPMGSLLFHCYRAHD